MGELIYSRCCVMRTSLLPFDEFLAWSTDLGASTARPDQLLHTVSRDTELLRERLLLIWRRTEVREAILVASPDLEREMSHWCDAPDSERGQKLERAFVRYFSRMTMRATPFGLFAGVSALKPGESTNLTLPERAKYTRRTRVDTGYVCNLARGLAQNAAIASELVLQPNPSMYRIAGKLRYTSSQQHADRRSYHLVQLEPDPLIDDILAQASAGASVARLAESILNQDERSRQPDDEPWTEEEARCYIAELLKRGALVHDLEPPVTGLEPLDALLARVSSIEAAQSFAAELQKIRRQLGELDHAGIGVAPQRYREVIALLGAVSESASPASVTATPANATNHETDVRAHWLQVDLAKPAKEASLGRSVLTALDRGLNVLRRIAPPVDSGQLDDFRARFFDRYETREVPLLEALDEELGVGLRGRDGMDSVPLLDGLAFPTRTRAPQTAWGEREKCLLEKVYQASSTGAVEVQLTDDDVARMQSGEGRALPEACYFVLSVAAESAAAVDQGQFRVLMRAANGPSGAAIAARFCHLQPEILDGVLQQLRAEEALHPGVALAELAHLPEGRVGNIASRPVLRELEIPIVTTSGVAEERQLRLTDLTLGIVDGRLVLKSTRLGCEVLPRMTNAHNYALGFTLYRFLCMLQGASGVSWSWGPLESTPFLPRVAHGNVIFSLACWALSKQDLAGLRDAGHGLRQAITPQKLAELRARIFHAADQLRARLRLPRFVLLVDGDNTLTVDFENVLSVDSFAQLVRSRSSVVLQELWPAPNELVARGPEGGFFHEIIAAAHQPGPLSGREVAERRAPVREALPRTMAPGSGCLYLKLYTGVMTADDVLRHHLDPFLKSLRQEVPALRWFFVRYADPEWHLRIRFFADSRELLTVVMPGVQELSKKLLAQGLVWRVQHDTYERELERYGGLHGVELAEELFCIDSETTLEILTLLEPARLAKARWLLALRGIDSLLASLGFELEQRVLVVTRARDALGREFGANTAFYQQLGDRFRTHKLEISKLFTPNGGADLAPLLVLIDDRSIRTRALGQRLRNIPELAASLDELSASYVHMHANRMLNTAAKAQELVLYDMLRRYYQSRLAVQGLPEQSRRPVSTS